MMSRPTYDFWRDADGVRIPERCRVEQVAVSKEHGALPSRLHQQGEVVGRGTTRLYVQFPTAITGVRPHLVRVCDGSH
ncbi:MAG: hypothetical protein ACRDSF_23310 [Pseudonocardiaceae bacterium]